MSVDTRNNIIAIIAAVTLGAVLIVSLIGILVLAAVHDGELANHALDTFNQIIIVVIPAFAALAGVERVVSGLTANRAISATSAVQVAQVAQGNPVNGNGNGNGSLNSDPAGVSLPDDSPDVQGSGV